MTFLSLQGFLCTSPSQASSKARANLATNSAWSRVSFWSSGKAATKAAMYALGAEYTRPSKLAAAGALPRPPASLDGPRGVILARGDSLEPRQVPPRTDVGTIINAGTG